MPNQYNSPSISSAEKLALQKSLQSHDLDGDGRLNATELKAYITIGIQQARETTAGCDVFLSFAYSKPISLANIPQHISDSTIERAQRNAIRQATATTNDLLKSSIGIAAFPQGVEAYATAADYAPLAQIVGANLKECAAILKGR